MNSPFDSVLDLNFEPSVAVLTILSDIREVVNFNIKILKVLLCSFVLCYARFYVGLV